jgi:polyisoprenoid-binding protein YceI
MAKRSLQLGSLVILGVILTIGLISGGGRILFPPTVTPTPTLLPPTLTPTPKTIKYALVDAQSKIGYDLILAVGGGKMPGIFNTVGQFIEAIPQPDGSYKFNVDLRLDGNSVTGSNGLVLGALKSSLEVDKYPYAYFTGLTEDSVKIGGTIKTAATGLLTMKNETRKISLNVTVVYTESMITAEGETILNLNDYKVEVPTALIKEMLTLRIKLTATRVP